MKVKLLSHFTRIVSDGSIKTVELLRKFVNWITFNDIDAVWFNRIFIILLASFVFGGVTNSIIGPFDGLSDVKVLIAILSFIIIGYLSSGIIANDSRWALPFFLITLLLITFYILSGLGTIKFHEWPFFWRENFGYVSISILSFWGGVLSGKMKSPSWMGNLLFKQHVLPKMKFREIQFMHWNKQGEMSLIELDDLVLKWVEDEKLVKLNGVQLNEYAPIILDEMRGNYIKSGIHEIRDIKSMLPPLWANSMDRHFTMMEEGHNRFCWLNLFQLTIPNSPSIVSQRRDIYQTNTIGITIDETSYRFSWQMPESLNLDQNKLQKKSVLSYWLTDSLGFDVISNPESKIVSKLFPKFSSNDVPATCILKSLSHLLLMLRHEMDLSSGSKKEQCRRSIIDISQFFLTLNHQVLPHINEQHRRSYHYITAEKWNTWIEYCLSQPATAFLRLHDILSEEINNENDSAGLKNLLAGILVESTDRVISASDFKPKNIISIDDYIDSKFGTEIANNRTISMLSGIWRMLILASLLRSPEEVVI
jgi:hypothetical protein